MEEKTFFRALIAALRSLGVTTFENNPCAIEEGLAAAYARATDLHLPLAFSASATRPLARRFVDVARKTVLSDPNPTYARIHIRFPNIDSAFAYLDDHLGGDTGLHERLEDVARAFLTAFTKWANLSTAG